MSIRDVLLAASQIQSQYPAWDVRSARVLYAPWFLNSARLYSGDSVSVTAQETVPTGVAFKFDGTKMYLTGQTSDAIYQYSLTTPWDVNTRTYDGVSFSISNLEGTVGNMFFKPSGDELWLTGTTQDLLAKIALSTPWNLSTATLVATPFSGSFIPTGNFSPVLSSYDNAPTGIVFHPDGDKLFYVGSQVDVVWAFSLSPAWDLSSIAPIDGTWDVGGLFYTSKSFSLATQTGVAFSLAFKTDGTELYVLGNSNIMYQYNLSTGWDISTASYTGNSFSTTTQDTGARGLFFKDDGLTFFMLGAITDSVYEYVLSTAWNLSTSSYTGNSFSIAAQETGPSSLFFKPDGTKMYVLGSAGDDINEYNLSVAWDITTASFSQVSSTLNQDTTPAGLTFSDDGLKVFTLGTASDIIYQYALTVAWDVSTITYQGRRSILITQDATPLTMYIKPDGKSLYVAGNTNDVIYQYSLYEGVFVGGQDTVPVDIEFKSDGSKMFVLGSTNDKVFEYDLSTDWDLKTAIYSGNEFSVAPYQTAPEGIAFSGDGDYLFITGNTPTGVIRFSLSTPWDITTGSINFDPYNFSTSVGVGFKSISAQEVTPQAVAFKTDGTKMYVIGTTGDDVNEYDLTVAWNVTTATFLRVSSALTQDATPTGLAFSSDGTKMFMCGSTNDTVYQYVLGTAWNVSTISYTGVSFSVASQDNVPGNIWFSSDGLRMFMVGSQRDYVWQYDLTVAWDLSTITFSLSPWNVRGNIYANKSFSVTSQEATPTGMDFSSDGSKLYVIGTTNDTVYQYSLTTPWDISTASYTSVSFAPLGGETTPQSVLFKPDGTRMYVVGQTRDIVFSYDLTSAWDLSTAAFTPRPWNLSTPFYFDKSFSVAAQDTNATGMFLGDGGTKLYVMGAANDTVYQYALSTANDISTASYSSISFSVASQETTPTAVFFKTDGTSMYIVGTTGDTIYQYDLGTAWNVSTASYTAKSFSVTSQENAPTAFYISPDGFNLFVLGTTADSIFQYVLGTAWDISTASYTGWSSGSLNVAVAETLPSGLFFKDDGTIAYVVGQTNDIVYAFRLGTPWSIRTINTASGQFLSFSITAQDATPQDIIFSGDGVNFYVLGDTNDTVYQFVAADGFSVTAQEGSPTDIAFKSDGSLMYVGGFGTDNIVQYALSTPWLVSSAVYLNINTPIGEATFNGFTFSPTGDTVFVIGSTNDTVFQIPLDIPWQVSSTASATGRRLVSINVSTQDATPQKVRFKSSGDVFYILGGTNDTIYQYDLVKTLSASGTSFGGIVVPGGLAISDDGYSVFVSGTITAGTTVGIQKFSLATAWDITTAFPFQSPISPLVITQALTDGDGSGWEGLSLSADGNYLYLVNSVADRVTQFSFTHGLGSPTTGNRGLAFSSDGKRVTFVSATTDRAYGYELNTAWDLTTETRVDVSRPFNTVETNPTAVTYRPDGSLGYIIGATTYRVREMLPNTDYYDPVTLKTNTTYVTRDTDPFGIFWKNDGTKFYVLGFAYDAVYQYSVTTPWDIRTASYEKIFVVTEFESVPRSVAFNKTGSEMYVLGAGVDAVLQFALGTPWEIDTAIYTGVSVSVTSLDVSPLALTFATTGDNFYVVGGTSGVVGQYRIYENFSILSQTTSPSDVTFKSDGTRMYVASSGTEKLIYQYSLSIPWFVSSASYEGASTVLAFAPNGIYIKPDGTQLFSVDPTSDRVAAYAMSVAWDITTISFTEKTFSVASQEATPNSLFFKPDGTKMYIIGPTGDDINEYNLSVAWDITTASFAQASSALTQEITPNGLYFKPDGSKAYICGTSGDAVFEYVLSTPWNVSTISYTGNSFSLSTYDLNPVGLDFNDNGTFMYFVGITNDRVYQFQLGV